MVYAKKILNNNVVVIETEDGKECIVMGSGLGYQRKPGEVLDETKIDKEFFLAEKENYRRFLELSMSIPLEYFKLGEEIILYAKTKLGKRLNESIYVSLVDHIYSAVLRKQEGIEIPNKLLWEIRRFYPDEFQVGEKALVMLKEKGIVLQQDEAAFIALHFVNAGGENQGDSIYEVMSVVQEISNIVKYYFTIEFDEQSVNFYRFITHLKFFAQRLISHTTYEDEESDDLLEVIQVKYKNSYACVLRIAEFLNEKYHYQLSNDEKLYLTIHIERIVYKSGREEGR